MLRTLADMGGTYPDAYDLLAQSKRYQCLTCPLEIDALPEVVPVETLAENATNPDFWKTDGDEEVKTARKPEGAEHSGLAEARTDSRR